MQDVVILKTESCFQTLSFKIILQKKLKMILKKNLKMILTKKKDSEKKPLACKESLLPT